MRDYFNSNLQQNEIDHLYRKQVIVIASLYTINIKLRCFNWLSLILF